MKGLLFYCFLTLCAFFVLGQNHLLLKGQTRDTTLAPVAFANVMAIDTATQEMKGFAVTDVKGNFQLRLEQGRVYELQVTFVGFVPISQYLKLDQQPDDPLVIIMNEAVNQLDQVTVVAEMPVLVRGDTISYKAEAFTKGDERKLEDVLEELPGFNIRDNGDIEVQGKRVDKVLVDGKEFFEGDTKLATKNIPADVVDRVQVLQNFNDIAPMQGLRDDQQLALNIELKGDKKRMVFGDVEAGGGPEKRFFGHANTFYYAPETSINFIGDGNNVGELALTLNDYFRMTGGMGSLASRNGTTFRVNAGDMDIPMTDRNSAANLTNYLGALNFTTRLSDKVQLSGFMIGFHNDVDMASNSQRTYPQLEERTEEELTTASSLDNRSGLGRFSVKYTPNYNLQVDYNFFGKRSTIDQGMMRNSQLLSGDNQLQEGSARMPQSMSHQLRMFQALNERNIISAEVKYNDEQNVSNQLLSSEQALFSSFLSSDVPLLQLNQDQSIDTRRLDGAFNYYYILNKTTHINTAFGINLSRQTLSTNLAGEGENVFSLDQDLDITNRYVRLMYKKKWNKLTVSPGVSFNSYTLNGASDAQENSQYVFPELRALYEFGGSHSLELDYRQSIEYNDVAAYSEGYVMSRYNTLLFGNAGLSPALSHAVGVNYRNYNMYNFFNIYGGLNFTYIVDGFTNNQQLQGVENVLTPVNAGSANHITSGYLNLEKRFDHFRVSGQVNLSQAVLNNQIENQVIENDNFTQNYSLNMSARLFKKLSVRTGYTMSLNRYSSGATTSRFVNHRPNIGATLTINGWRMETSYAYNNYLNKNQNQETSFDMLDASLSYRKKKSPWEFKVQGFNLLDTRNVRRDSFSDNLISTFSYAIQQRYGLFTVKYDL
ncbi:carboxypeptidase-like regulatory domain-containing protein [Ekhidna sp.]|uniref:carboxypeptidase-like regulatory domain-containing protein n=1 Tax=Ekhidna sp. TaxID=2608089 RepID=UPI003B5BAD7D